MTKKMKPNRTPKKQLSNDVRETILEVVATQLRDNNPAETRLTYERLLKQGISDNDARFMLGSVVVCEIFDVVKRGELFNLKRFCEKLNRLPDEPFAD